MSDPGLLDFLKPIELADEFKAIGGQMKVEVKRNMGKVAPLRPFTRKVAGRGEPGGSLAAVIDSMKPRVKKRGVSLGPSRAKRFQKLNYWIHGRSNKITRKQQVLLRAKGVKARLFGSKVMVRPPHAGPFKVGRTLFAPRRDPFNFARMSFDPPASIVLDKILDIWGFDD